MDVKRIHRSDLNPRTRIETKLIDELARSLSRVGMLEPMILRRAKTGYEIVVGERRYQAARRAGMTAVPALVGEFSDEQVLEMNLVENIQRQDLTDVEKGRCCLKLLDRYPDKYPTTAALAKEIGVSESTLRFWVQTARDLSPSLQKLVAKPTDIGGGLPRGRITSRTAMSIARKIPERNRQRAVAAVLARHQLPNRRARAVLKKVAREPTRPVEQLVKEVLEAPIELPFRLRHAKLIEAGAKTQTTRKSIPVSQLREGATFYAAIFEPRFLKLRVTSVERRRLGDFTAEDARREGGYSLSEFKRTWSEIHESDWDESESVYVVQFEVIGKLG